LQTILPLIRVFFFVINELRVLQGRLAILYCGGIFACRHCYNLAYPCQSETIQGRELRRIEKIRDRLGWEPGIFSKTGSRPKGMHLNTYKKLINEHNVLRMRTFDWFDSYLDKLERLDLR
jgi:hypothetical protein